MMTAFLLMLAALALLVILMLAGAFEVSGRISREEEAQERKRLLSERAKHDEKQKEKKMD